MTATPGPPEKSVAAHALLVRMRRIEIRRWCPPQSPLEIEIPQDLLVRLRPDPAALETSGVLYGVRQGNEVRILPGPREDLKPLGIFVARERGEVFLTETNLEFFEKQQAAVALVIAGNRCGFFVRESNGSIQTVRSHEEFSLTEAPPPVRAPKTVPPPRWMRPAAAIAALAVLPVAALAYFRPLLPPPALGLLAREQDGQLRVSWQPGRYAILEIGDGGERISFPVPPLESSMTYARSSGEVEIRLIPVVGSRPESARFVGPAPQGDAEQKLRAQIARLNAEAAGLRQRTAANRSRIAELETAIARLTAQAAP